MVLPVLEWSKYITVYLQTYSESWRSGKTRTSGFASVGIGRHQASKAKVADLQCAIATNQQILWLQIAMGNVVVVQVFETVQYIPKILFGCRLA